jgi:hypothetical protein
LISDRLADWTQPPPPRAWYTAASNLVDGLDEEHRIQFLDAATNFATNPPPSEADAFNASMSSPLGRDAYQRRKRLQASGNVPGSQAGEVD